MSKRTDIHRPSVMDPKAYRVLAVGAVDEYECPETGRMCKCLVLEQIDERWRELGFPETSTWEGHREYQCDHCGSHIKYYSVVEHIGTGEILKVGLTCTSRFFSTVNNWNYYQERLKTRLENDKRENTWMAKNPEATLAYQFCKMAECDQFNVWYVAKDIARKVREYGSLSEKQVAVMTNAYAKYRESLKVQDEKAAKPVVEVPEGKQTITGRVLSIKFDSVYINGYERSVERMLVEDDRGFRVFGTVPAGVYSHHETLGGREVRKGDRVTFTATVERSAKDAGFGFYKRPTKASNITERTDETDAARWAREDREAMERETVAA